MRNIYFPFLVLSIILFISWLNFRLLVRWTPQFRRRAASFGFWSLTILATLTIAYTWSTRLSFGLALPEWFRFVAYAALAWLIGQVIMLLLLPLLYIGKRLAAPACEPATEGGGTAAGPALTRRAFLRSSLVGVPAAALGLSTYGVYAAEGVLAERRHTLPLPGLPAAFDGLTVLQLSDTHIGPYFSLSMLDRLIARTLELDPDILVITGDLIDDLGFLAPAMEKLAALPARIRHGVYYCLGNHEYFRNLGLIRAALAKTDIIQVNNSSRLVLPGQRPLYIVGVDYPWADSAAGRRGVCRRFLGQALADVPADACKILIGHHPDFLHEGFANGIPLTLTGHTHGGQVVVFGKTLLPIQYDYMRGLYRQNGCFGFVNSGAGHWFPFRLGCPPEIALFTLKSV